MLLVTVARECSVNFRVFAHLCFLVTNEIIDSKKGPEIRIDIIYDVYGDAC